MKEIYVHTDYKQLELSVDPVEYRISNVIQALAEHLKPEVAEKFKARQWPIPGIRHDDLGICTILDANGAYCQAHRDYFAIDDELVS